MFWFFGAVKVLCRRTAEQKEAESPHQTHRSQNVETAICHVAPPRFLCSGRFQAIPFGGSRTRCRASGCAMNKRDRCCTIRFGRLSPIYVQYKAGCCFSSTAAARISEGSSGYFFVFFTMQPIHKRPHQWYNETKYEFRHVLKRARGGS